VRERIVAQNIGGCGVSKAVAGKQKAGVIVVIVITMDVLTEMESAVVPEVVLLSVHEKGLGKRKVPVFFKPALTAASITDVVQHVVLFHACSSAQSKDSGKPSDVAKNGGASTEAPCFLRVNCCAGEERIIAVCPTVAGKLWEPVLEKPSPKHDVDANRPIDSLSLCSSNLLVLFYRDSSVSPSGSFDIQKLLKSRNEEEVSSVFQQTGRIQHKERVLVVWLPFAKTCDEVESTLQREPVNNETGYSHDSQADNGLKSALMHVL
jgi:hypothetical protein